MSGGPPEDQARDEAGVKRGNLNLTTLGSLASEALSSEDHESYRAVAARGHFRIGVAVSAAPGRPASFRIEVLLQILAKDTRPSIADLERMNKVLETLEMRGYSLDHHDNCWISCEREIGADDVERECVAVAEIIQSQKSGMRDQKDDRRGDV